MEEISIGKQKEIRRKKILKHPQKALFDLLNKPNITHRYNNREKYPIHPFM